MHCCDSTIIEILLHIFDFDFEFGEVFSQDWIDGFLNLFSRQKSSGHSRCPEVLPNMYSGWIFNQYVVGRITKSMSRHELLYSQQHIVLEVSAAISSGRKIPSTSTWPTKHGTRLEFVKFQNDYNPQYLKTELTYCLLHDIPIYF